MGKFISCCLVSRVGSSSIIKQGLILLSSPSNLISWSSLCYGSWLWLNACLSRNRTCHVLPRLYHRKILAQRRKRKKTKFLTSGAATLTHLVDSKCYSVQRPQKIISKRTAVHSHFYEGRQVLHAVQRWPETVAQVLGCLYLTEALRVRVGVKRTRL